MKVALNTDYVRTSRDPAQIRSVLRALADGGITHAHWCHEWSGDYLYTTDEMRQIRSMLDEVHLEAKGVHATAGWNYTRVEGMYKRVTLADGAPDYTSSDETLRRAGAALIANRLELAAALGTAEIVLHMQLPYVCFQEDSARKTQYYQQALKSLDEVQPLARSLGVRICIENMVGTPNEYQFEQFDLLFNHFGPDYLGLCLDTGHAMLTNPHHPFELAERYQDRLYFMHLHDNHGYAHPGDFSDDAAMSRADEHLVPGDGSIDFDAFAKIVAASPYELPVVGETECRSEPEAQFICRSRDALIRFTEAVLQYKTT